MHQNPAHPRIDVPLTQLLASDQHLLHLADEALADATLRAGRHLACRPGCTQCCHGAFAISPLDALRLRHAMSELAVASPAQATVIAARASQYLERYGPEFPGDRQTGILGTSPEAETAFADFANEVACPALDPATGLCDLYAARPMTCRTFGPPVRHDTEEGEGFAVCELCFTEADPEEIAAAEMHPPLVEERALLGHFAPGAGETIVAYCLTVPSATVTGA